MFHLALQAGPQRESRPACIGKTPGCRGNLPCIIRADKNLRGCFPLVQGSLAAALRKLTGGAKLGAAR